MPIQKTKSLNKQNTPVKLPTNQAETYAKTIAFVYLRYYI